MKTINELARDVGNELKKLEWKLVTAESCTGGGLAYSITSIPGSSHWFERGLVTYSNRAKEELLGVNSITLSIFGSVSEQTVREMAEGALKKSQAQISLAITGIAGPDGGTRDKPIGTVWIGCTSIQGNTQSWVDIFSGDRQAVREQSITMALQQLIQFLSSMEPLEQNDH